MEQDSPPRRDVSGFVPSAGGQVSSVAQGTRQPYSSDGASQTKVTEQVFEKAATQRIIEKRLMRINTWRAWRSVVGKLLGIAVATFLIFSYIFGVTVQDNVGMSPAVKEGDIVLYYRLQNEYAAGDVIMYLAAGDLCTGRIVARGPDTVEVTDHGELIINGYVQANEGNALTMPAVDGISYPLVLNSECYFVLGDNREESKDSREFGVIQKEDIEGKVFTILRRRGI